MARTCIAFRVTGLLGRLTFCGAVTLAMFGCNGSQENVVDVRGRVTYKGQPVTTGTVRFTPTHMAMGEASSRPVTAVLDGDGSYRMKAYRSRFGMSPGDYAVSILSYEGSMMEPEKVKYIVPKKYADTRTSGLTATIPQDQSGSLELNFDIL
jgi:hypothetical protein